MQVTSLYLNSSSSPSPPSQLIGISYLCLISPLISIFHNQYAHTSSFHTILDRIQPITISFLVLLFFFFLQRLFSTTLATIVFSLLIKIPNHFRLSYDDSKSKTIFPTLFLSQIHTLYVLSHIIVNTGILLNYISFFLNY